MKKVITQTYLTNAPIEEVWKCLVDPKKIENWGGDPAKMSENTNSKFSLWDGDIWGKNKKVEKEKILIQDWYGGDWKEPSKVTFLLSKKANKTEVKLVHENLPENEIDNFNSGWKDYYLGAIKKYLEK